MEARRRRFLFLTAFLSGIPALISQIVWIREIALTAGSESEAMGLVVALFFSGVALGSAVFGPWADRASNPLSWYGILESGVGLALLTISVTSLIPTLADLSEIAGLGRRIGACLPILPATILMGGTLPALVREARLISQHDDPHDPGSDAGRLVALNTGGAVVGVLFSMLSIPLLGLHISLLCAGLTSLAVGTTAIWMGHGPTRSRNPETICPDRPPGKAEERPYPLGIAATLSGCTGAATIGFEVILGRSTALALGSSLYAWGLVLMWTLASLTLGYALGGRRLPDHAGLPGRISVLLLSAAAAMLLAPIVLGHHPATPAHGLTPISVFRTLLSVAPAMTLTGMTFPAFVKWGARDSHRGHDFGWISATNTAGGVVGSIATGFWILPALGPSHAFTFTAVLAAATGLFAAARTPPSQRKPAIRAVALVLVTMALRAHWKQADPLLQSIVISIDHGRRATTVVQQTSRSRELIVDGEPEASTFGRARRTEELLAVLPFVLHPNPERFLELGLGSGITLATAARFAPSQLDCVEIAPSVVRAQKFFAPDNGTEAGGLASTARISMEDARSFLRRRAATYDIIVANTAQPWSIQATGLYSVEYYRRALAALRDGGFVAQWLPYERISKRSLAEILQTFFTVFDYGGLWWGDGSILLLGSAIPLPRPAPNQTTIRLSHAGLSARALGMADDHALSRRRVAAAGTIRKRLEGTAVLSDDRPRLEGRHIWTWITPNDPTALALLLDLAEAQLRIDRARLPITLFIESLLLHATGDIERAERIQGNLAVMGLALGDAEQRERTYRRLDAAFQKSDLDAARSLLEELDAHDRSDGRHHLATALLALANGQDPLARQALERASQAMPNDPYAPSLLGELLAKSDLKGARAAFDEALARDPFSIRALAASGMLYVAKGDFENATLRLERLEAISPLGERPETAGLRTAIHRARNPSPQR